jgi:hypothetical protein
MNAPRGEDLELILPPGRHAGPLHRRPDRTT